MNLFGWVNLDFVLDAYLFKGGKRFICLLSAMMSKGGKLKGWIVPSLTNSSIVTNPGSAIHYVMTKYGMVSLKGASV